jgi:hypothetical protein
MSGIFGALGLADTERVMLSSLGQRVVFDAVQQVLGDHNADLQAALSVFVQETTSDYKIRYKLPGSGRLQRMGNQAQPGAVKAYGGWDIALPLEEWGAGLAHSRVAFGYMTTQELNRHLDTIMVQDRNTVRFEMLKALFNDGQDTFVDPIWGSLSIEPLANGDTVVYPPVLGSESEATDDHYAESGYTVANMSDTNNPFSTIASDLEEHFGTAQGGNNIAAFCNTDIVAEARLLTDFVPVSDMGIRPGDDTAQAINLPAALPGRVVGRMDGSGVWVIEWRWIPATFILALDLDAPKPLMQRIDPADTGLGTGLQLVATSDQYPFTESFYSHRFGFGVGNRLNGYVMEVSADGNDYTEPTVYA